MRSVILLSVLFLISLSRPLNTVHAQETGVTHVYLDQFLSLYSQAQKLWQRFEQGKVTGNTLMELEKQNLALGQLINGLSEDVAKQNLEDMKRGREYNRDFALVIHGCDALELTLHSAQDYAETGDRTFLGIAHSAEAIAADIRKLFAR
jgi:hypothetical protein